MKRHTRTILSSPGGRAARLPNVLGAMIMAAMVFMAAPQASAAKGSAQIFDTHFPKIRVAASGFQYSGPSPSLIGYAWTAQVEIQAKPLTRIKDWSAWVVLDQGVQAGLPLAPAYIKSYAFGARPKHVNKTVGKVFPANAVSNFVREACNQNAQNLRQSGHSDDDIFGQEHTISAVAGFHVTVNLTGNLDVQDLSDLSGLFFHNTEIICERSLAAGAPGGMVAPTEFKLKKAVLVVTPRQYTGKCPKDLTLTMAVSANHNGPFEARVESTDGWKSKPMTARTSQLNKQAGTWKNVSVEKFGVPYDWPKGRGGPVDTSDPGAFASPTQPVDPLSGKGGGGFGAADGLKGNEPYNMHKASFRLIATANGQTVKSPWQSYSVTCKPQTVFDGPSGMAGAARSRPRSTVRGGASHGKTRLPRVGQPAGRAHGKRPTAKPAKLTKLPTSRRPPLRGKPRPTARPAKPKPTSRRSLTRGKADLLFAR